MSDFKELQTAHLENWRLIPLAESPETVDVIGNKVKTVKHLGYLMGVVTGHPIYPNGEYIHTSHLDMILLNIPIPVGRTRNTAYTLGKRDK